MLFWMSPCLSNLSSSITGEKRTVAANNITTTATKWGKAEGSALRKSMEVMDRKLLRHDASRHTVKVEFNP